MRAQFRVVRDRTTLVSILGTTVFKAGDDRGNHRLLRSYVFVPYGLAADTTLRGGGNSKMRCSEMRRFAMCEKRWIKGV